MPYPYIVPAVVHFDKMYYRYTYFTNKGLIIDGRATQAKHTVDNMLYMIGRYGFMPNGNRTYYLTNSQPPFLSCMVRDTYEYYHDLVWLYSAYHILEKKYEFWQTKRGSNMGLNHYDGVMESEKITEQQARYFEKSVGFMPDVECRSIARHCIAACKSDWDINPRFDYTGYSFAAVDLNSLLFMMEGNMDFFAVHLKNGGENLWYERAEKRKRLMLETMDDGSGLLLDYNFVTGKLSSILSAASFYPLFTGVAKQKKAHTPTYSWTVFMLINQEYACTPPDSKIPAIV